MTGPGATRAPRVMYLATSMGVGGAEQQARYLARSFRRRGWDVMVVSMIPLAHDEAALRAEGIVVHSLDMRPGMPDPRGMARLVRLLREFRPDVLHSLMVHANLLARIVRPITRPPVVVSSVHTPNEGRQWRYIAYRLTNWLTDCTTAVSQDAIDVATRRGAAPRDGIRLIGNGIDLDEYRPDPATRARVRDELGVGDAFTWLAVGRMTGAKAYPDMVSAFADLQRTDPNARLLIAGSGEPDVEAAVAVRIAETGVGDGLSLLGYRSDVADLMRAADGFLLSSAWEGLPMVLLEAASSELPIVATRVGGNEDAVTDGVNGLLVPAGDPAALARAMRTVMATDPEARHAMGRAGRELVRHGFDLEATIDTWVALYTELLDRKRAPRGTAGQPNRS
jgi:glycosyltransferase involved in cell wall biosynthesis